VVRNIGRLWRKKNDDDIWMIDCNVVFLLVLSCATSTRLQTHHPPTQLIAAGDILAFSLRVTQFKESGWGDFGQLGLFLIPKRKREVSRSFEHWVVFKQGVKNTFRN